MTYKASLDAFSKFKPEVAVQQGAAAFAMACIFKQFFHDINAEFYNNSTLHISDYKVHVDNLLERIKEIPSYNPEEN